MHKFWQFFVTKNRFSFLMMVALAGFGLLSVAIIPKESAPEVQIPVGVVTTVLPGAPASDIETLVTNEIERGIAGTVENVDSITSTSREGVSSIVVEFDEDADIDASIQELKDQVDTVIPDLPDDAEDPVITDVDFVEQPIMTVAISGSLNDSAITELMDDLETEIENISGVSRIVTSGVREREVTVVVDPAALNRFEMNVTDVVNGLSRANLTFPIGQIEQDGVKYNIAFEGDILNTAEIENVSLTTRGGQPVYVRDVASVEDSLGENRTASRLSLEGSPSESSVTFDVFKQRGGDITAITASVNDRLDALQEEGELLQDVTVLTVLDSGADINEDLIRLSTSGATTVVLVMLVLFVAIGWREGLVAGSAIPLSFLIGFIGLNLSGNTINFVSLFSLILAIGILVDSAIVMVEGINRRMKDNPKIDKRDAALLTIKDFSTPIIAGTLTTVSMFSGLFLVSGVTGQFIAAIPFTINFILFASLLVALGFVPLLGSTFLRRRSSTRIEQCQVEYAHRLETWYREKLTHIIGNKKRERIFLWGISAALVVALILPITGVVRVIFFEQSDIDWIYAEIELPQGSVKEETDIAFRRVEEVLYTDPDIESFVSTIGQAGAFGGNAGSVDEKYGNAFITLREDREVTSTDVVERLRKEFVSFTDITVTVDQPSDGPPTGAELGYRFLGDDLVELTELTNRAAEELKRIPNTTNIQTSTNNNSTEIVFNLNRAKTAALGLDPLTVSQTLRSAVFGADATSLTTLDSDIDVVVKLDLTSGEGVTAETTNITTLDTLKNIRFINPQGETVLLSSLVETSLRESSNVISHDEQRRVISISAGITSGGSIPGVNAAFEDIVRNEIGLPDGVTLEIGGETEESNQAFIEMFLALIVGVVLMLAVLVLQFNSFRHTLYVLSILPFSLIGIMAGLAITQLPLSFPSIMGFIALSGIVVNNSILLIDMMNQNRKLYPEKSIQENVMDAATARLRPILLTTLTTVVGMIPLTYASDLWSPLAYAIMFGLTFSVVITLLLVPIIYNRNPGTLNN